MAIVSVLRVLKLCAVILYATGTIGATLPLGLRERRWFAYRMAGPGFGLTWTLGFVWAAYLGVPLTSTFILVSMAASLLSLQAVLYLAGREGRGGPVSTSLALGPLVLCVVLMVVRP